MKYFIIPILALLLVAGLFVVKHHDTKIDYVLKDACTVLTQADADAVIGVGSARHVIAVTNPTPNDIAFSSCAFSIPNDDGKGVKMIAEFTVRAAKSETGIASNRKQFSSTYKSTAPLKDIGDKAFIIKPINQIFVLKHNNWYTINAGHIGKSPEDPNQGELSEKLARRIAYKL